MEGFFQDLTLAWRRLCRRRGLTLVVVCTLALAVGLNTALFSVFHTLVLQPLPYPQPQRLAWLAESSPSQPTLSPAEVGFSPPDFVAYRADSRDFSALAAFYPNVATLLGHGLPQHVAYANVTGGFFSVLGVAPALGRGILLEDEQPPLPQVAVLSDSLWRQRYGADAHILGRPLELDHQLLTVVGVMPAGFNYPAGAQLWTPEPLFSPQLQKRSVRYLNAIGRLRPGATLAGAQDEMAGLAQRLAAAYPETDGGMSVSVRGLADESTQPFRATLALMLAAAGLVLIMACANIANLLLAGAVERWREMALRSALGAPRRRLLRQLLTEGLALALAGGAAGWLLAGALLPLLRRLHPPGLPPLTAVHLDLAVFAFTALATLATALWMGLAPAWELLRPATARSLHRASSHAPARSRLAATVAIAEIAAAVVLLTGAGLLLQSLRRLQRVNPGFNSDGVLTFRASLLFGDLREMNAGAPFFNQLDLHLQSLPGIQAAGLVSALPLGLAPFSLSFYPAGSPAASRPLSQRPRAGLRLVLPGYFDALRIPVRGRAFDQDDTPASPRVAIVNQALAQSLFPDQDALGQFLRWGTAVNARIVGIAGNVSQSSLAQPPGWDIYEPFLQAPVGDMSVVVRTRGDPWALLPRLRRQVTALNPEIAVYEVASLPQQLRAATAPDRFRAGLMLALAALALLLALAGIHGVLSHSVAQRRREIAIRMALGATPAQVRRMLLAQSLRLILAGVAAGLLGSYWLGQALRRWLFTVAPNRPLVLIAVSLLVTAAALVASYLPARQAARRDPLLLLRD